MYIHAVILACLMQLVPDMYYVCTLDLEGVSSHGELQQSIIIRCRTSFGASLSVEMACRVFITFTRKGCILDYWRCVVQWKLVKVNCVNVFSDATIIHCTCMT